MPPPPGGDPSAALLAEARGALAAGDPRGCERACRAALKLPGGTPPSPELSRLLALALHGLKRSTEAVLHQRRAALEGGEAQDYYALGVMELASGPVSSRCRVSFRSPRRGCSTTDRAQSSTGPLRCFS